MDSPIQSPPLLPAMLSLFASGSTLICCALPAILVSLGMGAVMAGLIETVPGITFFGKHKTALFILAAIILALSAFMQWRARNVPCPIDPQQARACARLRRFSWIIWFMASILYAIGFFFAFLAKYVL